MANKSLVENDISFDIATSKTEAKRLAVELFKEEMGIINFEGKTLFNDHKGSIQIIDKKVYRTFCNEGPVSDDITCNIENLEIEQIKDEKLLLKNHIRKGKNKVKEIEKHFDITLPDEYRDFLLNFNIEFHGIFEVNIRPEILKENESILFECFLKVESNNKSLLSIIDYNSEINQYIDNDMFIFGSDSDGLFIIDLESGVVYYEDSCSYLEYSRAKDTNIYKIAESFNEFLDEIYFISDTSLENYQYFYPAPISFSDKFKSIFKK